MDDLISRQAAIDAINSGMIKDDDSSFESPNECNSMLEWAVNAVKELPTAEKTGKWETEYDTHTKMLACSACGGRVIYSAYTSAVGTKGYAYCPYCGARMEEE